jgi:hypothetical protein
VAAASPSPGHWSATSDDLTVQPRWANDHQRPGRLVTGHNEAVRTVPRHEHEAARGGDPPVVVAEPLQLSIKQVEHLVFTSMEMCRHGEPRRVGALHNGELAERLRTRGLDDNASAVPVIGVALIRRTDIPAHRAPPPIARPPVWPASVAHARTGLGLTESGGECPPTWNRPFGAGLGTIGGFLASADAERVAGSLPGGLMRMAEADQ